MNVEFQNTEDCTKDTFVHVECFINFDLKMFCYSLLTIEAEESWSGI